MATKKTTATEAAKKTTTTKTTTKKAAPKSTKATTAKKTTVKKEEVVDADFREVDESGEKIEEAKVDPAEAINPPEDTTTTIDFNIYVESLLHKYGISDKEGNPGTNAIVDSMNFTMEKLISAAELDPAAAELVVLKSTDTLVSEISNLVKVQKKVQQKAEKLQQKVDKLEKKAEMTREQRNQILYGGTSFGANGIYTPLPREMYTVLPTQIGGEQ